MNKILRGLPVAFTIMIVALLGTTFIFLMLIYLNWIGFLIVLIILLVAMAYDIGTNKPD